MKQRTVRPLIFIECAEPGGAERAVLTLAEEYRRQQAESVVVCLETGWLTEQLEERGLRWILLRSERPWDVALVFRLAWIARRERCNVIHSHLLDSNFYAAWAARAAGLPHLGTDHGDVQLPYKRRLRRTKLRLATLAGSYFTAVSSFTARRLIELGVPGDRVATLGNPVQPPYRCAPGERDEIRLELGVRNAETCLWLHAAMLKPVKDQATLFRAFAHSASRATGAQILAIAGDGPEKAPLMRLAAELGIADRIRLLGVRNDVPRLLAAADGFVLSSVSEALPLSVLEAAAAGLAIVSTRVGGVGELIAHGVNGLTCNSADPSALGEVMYRAAADDELRIKLGSEARRMALERFSAAAVAELYLKIFDNMLSDKAAFSGLPVMGLENLGS